MGDWIQTSTNIEFDILNVSENDINILDIASALSKICRFGGHCNEFYSVAQHSILVSELVLPQFKLHALLHDASEAYLGDIPRPIKHLNEFKFYRDIENKVSKVIYRKYGTPEELDQSIKYADTQMLFLEASKLMPTVENWKFFNYNIIPTNIDIYPLLSPSEAYNKFLDMFKLYKGKIQ